MNLIIVSGVSGVGKSTIVKMFIEENSEKYELARSVTTRKARTENEYYTFVSREEFQALLEEGAFLETNLYQDSKKLMERLGEKSSALLRWAGFLFLR